MFPFIQILESRGFLKPTTSLQAKKYPNLGQNDPIVREINRIGIYVARRFLKPGPLVRALLSKNWVKRSQKLFEILPFRSGQNGPGSWPQDVKKSNEI